MFKKKEKKETSTAAGILNTNSPIYLREKLISHTTIHSRVVRHPSQLNMPQHQPALAYNAVSPYNYLDPALKNCSVSVLIRGTSHYEEKTTVQKTSNGTTITTRRISSSSVQSYTSEHRSYSVSHSQSAGNFPSLLANDVPLSLTSGSSLPGTGGRLLGSSSLGGGNLQRLQRDLNPNISTTPAISGSSASSSYLPRTSLNSPATTVRSYGGSVSQPLFGSYPLHARVPVLPSIATQNAAQSLPSTTDDIVPTYSHKSEKLGKALVINNIKFMGNEERHGAKKDSADLIKLLKKLGFTVEHKSDLKAKDMKKSVENFSKSDFKRYGISLVVIMSHGNNLVQDGEKVVSVRGGFTQIVGVDDVQLLTDDIVELFTSTKCDRNLRGKPKIFIFQCCRGEKDQLVCHDAGPRTRQLKDQTDMLIAFSTLPGYLSNRDPNKGTWYIQNLCEVFEKYHKAYHVEDMLKIVDDHLANMHPKYTQTSTYENRGFKRCFLFKDTS